MKMLTELTLNVELSGSFTEGKQSYFNRRAGQWEPPQDMDLSNFKVTLVFEKQQLEITTFLDKKTIDRLQAEFIEGKEHK